MNLTKRLDEDAVEGITTIKGKGKFFKKKKKNSWKSVQMRTYHPEI